ncbi:helix-turn-helix domain-containing protein [Dactylosporangium sp. CA-092794]|uniref:helix-turn-helix domain-containing protein n=1 Tax=Dactylosporangium sp. CA-092794 TaxID=3239929 RepID=UPI003D8F0349
MGRAKKPITRPGRVGNLAGQVRLLVDEAGLTLRDLRERTGMSLGTLSNAQGGDELPTWNVLSKIVTACGGDLADWRTRWENASEFSRSPAPVRVGNTEVLAPASAMTRREWRQMALRELNGPPPIPITAQNAADFNDYMRRLKIWAGDPPVRELAYRMQLSSSTVGDLMRRRDRLPSLEALSALLAGCGVADDNVVREWLFAWRRIKLSDYKAPRQLRPRHRPSQSA